VAPNGPLDLPRDSRQISASWAIRSHLMGVSIAIAEMEPQRMGGYGPLDPQGHAELARMCNELERIIGKLDAYLGRAPGEDLAQRLARLEAIPIDPELLVNLERIIADHGLLEFHPLLDAIVDRLESGQFVIGFFGRVSSGKSSLLNHMLGRQVLPIGVTPVTAVPHARACRQGSRAADQVPVLRSAALTARPHRRVRHRRRQSAQHAARGRG
jgi:hypothetical protein